MRVNKVVSKNAIQLYIIKSVRVNGKNTSKIIEKLGNVNQIQEQIGPDKDPYEWANQRAKELTLLDKHHNLKVKFELSPSKRIEKDKQNLYNGGYLFLSKIFHELKLDVMCDEISNKYKFDFDLSAVLHDLICARVIYPSSKLSTFEQSNKFLEKKKYDLQHVYRALDVLAKEQATIQQHLYKSSTKVVERNTQVLYYDCTNFFFDIAEGEGLKQYGKSKENRPLPIVELGLFLDGNGLPLGFSIHSGNTNEQTTLKPLEQQIIRDYELSKLVVCTDGGLSSKSNKQFNSIMDRSYITVQSLKKLKQHLKDWSMDPKGWKLSGSGQKVDISEIELINNPNTYYKERWINENGIEERLIVSFSAKYKLYQQNIRNKQIERAGVLIEKGSKRKGKNQNDPARLIKQTQLTKYGEVAEDTIMELDFARIAQEEQYDGFYGVVTNLEDDVQDIIKVNQRRWEIEETFRIMKSEMKARPVYLKKDERIEAHFLTCFIAVLFYRILEQKLEDKYTVSETINTLREMNLVKIKNEGYIPVFTRTQLTDELHEIFGFELDTEIIDSKKMKEIKKVSKKRNITTN